VVGGQRFLSLRRGQRCARTPSEYMREAALGARETQMPAWDTLRDFRNELIRLTAAIQATPAGPAVIAPWRQRKMLWRGLP
jgi:hypothetical protein